jgi:hypothetical protein
MIPPSSRHRIDLIESSVQFTSGKRGDMKSGVRTLPTRLSITHVDRWHSECGTFDQPSTAVADERIKTTEKSDEDRSIQMVDHEEAGPFYRVHDAGSTDIPVGFEHDGGTSL